MIQKKTSLTLLIGSTLILSGCLDDKYDYGDTGGAGGGGGGGDTGLATDFGLNLYRVDAADNETSWRQPFTMTMKDSTSDEVTVDTGPNENGNITIDNVDFHDFTTMNVAVEADVMSNATASISFSANKPVNTVRTYHGWANGDSDHINWNKGSLSFEIQPEASVDADEDTLTRATVTLRDQAGNSRSVDVTSAVIATTGAQALQEIKLPLSCFFDSTDVDPKTLQTAIEFETEGPVRYSLANVRWMANSMPDNWGAIEVQPCSNSAQIESDDITILRHATKIDGETVINGWAPNVSAVNGNVAHAQPAGSQDDWPLFVGINHNNEGHNPDNKSYFIHNVLLDDNEKVDLSQYMETGAVEFFLALNANSIEPSHESWEIAFKLDGIIPEGSTGGISSLPVGIDMSNISPGAMVYRVSIPMKDLFSVTYNAGQDNEYTKVLLNALQNVKNFVSFAQSKEDDGHHFAGLVYSIAEVKINKFGEQEKIFEEHYFGDAPADNELSENVYLYKADKPSDVKKSPFEIQIEDNNGNTAEINADGLVELDNISIETQDLAGFAPLTVTVTGEESATLRFTSEKSWNLDATYNTTQAENGVISFSIKPLVEQGTHEAMLLSMSNAIDNYITPVDISSAVAASRGSNESQQIIVPMHCFVDQGLDINSVNTALSLDITGQSSFEISDVELYANGLPDNWAVRNIQSCDNLSSQTQTDEINDVRRVMKESSGNVKYGWAPEHGVTNQAETNWGQPAGWAADHNPIFAGITHKNNSGTSYFTHPVDIDNYDTVDLAQYIENGALEFYMNSSGTRPNHDWVMRFKFDSTTPQGSTGALPTNVIDLNMQDLVQGDAVYKVSIPLKKLFVNDDGVVLLNSVQNVNKVTTFAMSPSEQDNFIGYVFRMAGVVINKNSSNVDTTIDLVHQP
ncbi:hypothetical protein VIN01S_26580 [Vibrio inusitatus NBRC 102082]|uniref:ExoP galactose-binding-like domain-containing protein n=1 Tax=Vibrio inusitatus NBRC 102082 TaxID=1219070 RepID=A0A4Y3I079_9VIBR|nr:putative glycoside hydrolase [Vibrio inusitatus]GEA51854.1 hypothetical protein VIN01S_26580 [Vibrio inusitatus NBRC 102082]